MARSRNQTLALVLLAVYGAALLCGPLAFLAPGAPAGRREALQAAAGAAVLGLGAEAAWADAQGEPARALQKYGPPVLALKDAVDKGDMQAVLKKENKLKLLVGYWRNSAEDYKKQSNLVEALLDAAAEGKKDEVKKLYTEFTSRPELQIITKLPKVDRYHVVGTGQSMATR